MLQSGGGRKYSTIRQRTSPPDGMCVRVRDSMASKERGISKDCGRVAGMIDMSKEGKGCHVCVPSKMPPKIPERASPSPSLRV